MPGQVASSELQSGLNLGHYIVAEKIGEGGMGEVYRARDQHLDRDVAVKVLPHGILADEAARRQFHKEALALSRLNHPNIAVVHDFDTHQGIDVLVMEYIPGVTLSTRLASGPMSEEEVTTLGTQLAHGLQAAHEHGVIHGDLKPGNLRVTPDGWLKILDFGLAKLIRSVGPDLSTASLSERHAFSGTLPYMAPEQLRGEKVDARTDIYGLGAVLYEMATGKRLFQQKEGPLLIDAILHEDPAAPSKVNLNISGGLEAIVMKAVEKDRTRRYASVGEVVAVDEIERVEPEPAGHRRAGGEREHDADQHQRADGGKREPVDRPPPFAEGRALRARNHVPFPSAKLTRDGLRSINSARHCPRKRAIQYAAAPRFRFRAGVIGSSACADDDPPNCRHCPRKRAIQ